MSLPATDVLVVGTGPAGSAASLALATYGVDHVVITTDRWTADTPRAHTTNQRTTEVLRDRGVEDRHAAWRSAQPVDDAHAVLRDVLCRVLDRDPERLGADG